MGLVQNNDISFLEEGGKEGIPAFCTFMKSHCLQLPILLVQCGMLLERTMSTMVLATASKEPDSKVIFLCRNVIL